MSTCSITSIKRALRMAETLLLHSNKSKRLNVHITAKKLHHTSKFIRRFDGIYAYCRYFIDRKW